MPGLPAAPRASQRWSSEMMNTKLGRAASGRESSAWAPESVTRERQPRRAASLPKRGLAVDRLDDVDVVDIVENTEHTMSALSRSDAGRRPVGIAFFH